MMEQADVNTICDCYLKGDYSKCLSTWEKFAIAKFSPSQIQASSNKNVCKLLKDLFTAEGKPQSAVKQCLDELEQRLTELRSFPPTLGQMEVELVIVYNWLYLNLVLNVTSVNDDFLCQWGEHILNSLQRVGASVKLERSVNPHHPDDDVFEHIVSMLHALEKYSELLKVYRVLAPLCFAVSAWSACLMFSKKHTEAVSCLETVSRISSETRKEAQMPLPAAGLLMSLPVTVDYPSNDRQLVCGDDLVHLLLGLLHFRLQDWSKSRDCLGKVQSKAEQQEVKLIIGTCHLSGGCPDKCISTLQEIEDKKLQSTAMFRARKLKLMGECYAKQGLHHCAVQLFREALQVNFKVPLPLFYISQQYRAQGLDDAELEALNLLVTILEDKSYKSEVVPRSPVISFWSLHICKYACPDTVVSLPQALYILASRCLHLGRYADGAQRYLDLLALLQEDVFPPEELSNNLIQLPAIFEVYKEAAKCLLKSEQFEECVTVCDHALASISLVQNHPVSSNDIDDVGLFLSDDSLDVLPVTPSSSRKRLRTRSHDLSSTNQWHEAEHYLNLTLCKTDALIRLKQQDTAADSLYKAIELLQECGGGGGWSPAGDTETESSEPAAKRQRVTGDNECLIKTEVPGPNVAPWKLYFVDACCKFSSLLSEQEKYGDALHYARLAAQINTGESREWYLCCNILHKMGREMEAARSWLEHRKVESFHHNLLGRELHKRQTQLR